MRKCHTYRDQLVDALYGELDADKRPALDHHLNECRRCATEFAQMQATFGIMTERVRQEPDAAFWDGFWASLAPKIEQSEAPAEKAVRGWRRAFSIVDLAPAWFFRAASAVALLAVGIFFGKLYFAKLADQPAPVPVETVEVANASIDDLALRYIERSKVLLLGFVNYDAKAEQPYLLDIPRQKQVSRALMQEASYLEQNLTTPEQQQLRKLIGDLEVILLQIANLENQHNMPGIELVKDGVDRKGILLKINLAEMREAERKTMDSEISRKQNTRPKI